MKKLSQRIKLITLGLVVAALTGFSLVPATVNAATTAGGGADTNSINDACSGLTQVDSSQTCGTGAGESTIDQIITLAVNILSWVVGVVAVIAIIISGFRYVTAAGDSGKISAAKTTLIYALVGLVIVALAQFLVYFTLNEGTSAVNGTCASNSSISATDPRCK